MTTLREFHVLGPPGTGKTTYLVRQIRSAVERLGREGVCVVSFTRAAAGEIAARCGLQADPQAREGQGGPDDGADDSASSDGLAGGLSKPSESERRIGTLHALCYHRLDRPEIAEANLKSWNEHARPDFRLTLETGADDPEWSGNTKGGDRTYLQVQKFRARRIKPALWPTMARQFYAGWRKWKLEQGYLDFTDLIEVALVKDIGPPMGVCAGIVDEAQDFTRLELDLVASWAETLETVVLAYDDDQAIYGFKGASPDALIARLPGDEHTRVLSQSYRVPKAVHAVACKWIARVSGRAEKDYLPRDEKGEVRHLSGATIKCPAQAIEAMQQDLREGLNVMVLCTCGFMLRKIIREFRERGIPFWNPYRPRGEWNPLRRKKRASAMRLVDYLRRNERFAASEGEARLHMWTHDDLHRITEPLSSDCLQHGAKAHLARLCAEKEVREAPVEEAKFLSPDHLGWFSRGELKPYLENLLGSKRKGFEYPAQVARNLGLEGLEAEPRIVVGTVHSVKGGEADSVYVFPDLSPEGERRWAGSAKGQDEIRRLFYVAFTRAKMRLTLCAGSTTASVSWNG